MEVCLPSRLRLTRDHLDAEDRIIRRAGEVVAALLDAEVRGSYLVLPNRLESPTEGEAIGRVQAFRSDESARSGIVPPGSCVKR